MANVRPESLDEIVSHSAIVVAEQIQQAANWAGSEMDLQIEVAGALKEFARRADVKLEGHHNITIATGRPDSVYGSVIVEYKEPGVLSANRDAAGNRKVIEQLKQRFYDMRREEGRKWNTMFGAGTDGKYFIFLRFRDEKWTDQEPLPVDRYSTERFLWALYNLGQKGKPYQPEYLHGDFGSESETARAGVRALYEEILATQNAKTQVLFSQWKILFGEVCGYDVEHLTDKVRKLGESYLIQDHLQPAQLLFALHTYYALLIKLLAAEIVSFFNWMPRQVEKLRSAGTSARLKRELEELERGGIFFRMGITNFLEGDLFSWYLSSWNTAIEHVIRRMTLKLDEYNPGTFSEDPVQSRDLLKKLYQQLFPKSVRHDLGEYFTPDWLAEHMLTELNYEGDPDKRILDPGCGSGTFLVMAISRIRRWYDRNREKLPYGESELLKKILANVVGFDLNPLAVMAARTNYLVSIKDLLRYSEHVEIPVYLCDSIITPAETGSHETQISFLTQTGAQYNPENPPMAVNTAVGIFLVPKEITDSADKVARYAAVLESSITDRYSFDQFSSRCHDEGLDVKALPEHRALYGQLLRLDEQGKNGIWARIIKNNFAPLFVGRVDFIAGNPPWVRWGYLPRDYRESTVPLWQKYGLFSLKGFEARLGSGEKDLSQLFTYVSIDRYLKHGGKLGFLITKTVFKAKGQAEGFRRFQLGNSGEFIRILHVDDLSLLQPFEGASNLTTSFVALKGDLTQYPVPFTVWTPKRKSGISSDSSLPEVLTSTVRSEFQARPLGPLNGQWQTSRRSEQRALEKVTGSSSYKAAVGARVEPYGVYLLRVIHQLPGGKLLVENMPELGKRNIPHVTREIESDLLYPIARGKDIQRWFATPSALVLMVQDPETRRGFADSWLKKQYPSTYHYLAEFRPILEARAAYRKYHAEGGHPFYSMFNISAETFAPMKVAWRRMGNQFKASIVSTEVFPPLKSKQVIPSDTVTFIPVNLDTEAYYLVALLNSVPARAAIYSYSPSGRGLGTPAILKNLNIRRYDKNQETHRTLAKLGEKLTALHQRPEPSAADVQDNEIELQRLAISYWDLTAQQGAALKEAVEEQELSGSSAEAPDDDIHSRMFSIGQDWE